MSSSGRGYHTVGGGAGTSGATAGGETHPRPYSALMASIFSPPLTLSQTACAEAAASVAPSTGFSVPAAYDSKFYNHPDVQSVLVHSVASSDTQSGLQALVVLHPKTSVPAHLGIRGATEETAHLMVSPKNQPFLSYCDAPKAAVMAVSVPEYLTLLSFWSAEWPRLKSKLLHQAEVMREGLDPVTITSRLSFFSHGISNYCVSLSSRLTLRAKADSRSSKEDECLRVWLELKLAASGSSGENNSGFQALTLPLEALTTLAKDSNSIKTLTDLVASYKSRSRKRTKPVS